MKEVKAKRAEPVQSSTENLLPLRILLIAGWVGLVTGLAEAVFLVGWRQFYWESIINVGPEVLWMAPLTEMGIFLIVGIFLTLLAWLLPGVFTIRVAFFFLGFLSFVALLLLFPQLHIFAKCLLASGLAIQAARLIGKHQNGFYRLVRRTSMLLVALVTCFSLAVFIWGTLAERQALANLPPAASSSAPNVILITLDTVRAKSLSLYGYERQTTPQLDRFARDGAVFERAVATSPWTLPSHGSIFTGRYRNELSADWVKPLDKSYLTLAEDLGKRGYESAGFVANFIYCSKEHGLNRGFIHYEDYSVSVGQMILSSSLGRAIAKTGFIRRTVGYHDTLNRKTAEVLNDDFLKWLSSRDQSRPFFAFLNYFDAHEPLLPPVPFDERFGSSKPDASFYYDPTGHSIELSDKRNLSEMDVEKLRNSYDNSIAYLDQKVGELITSLSSKGILANTLVVITSDHGELLGEHRLFSHGNSLYIEALRVPLLIHFPSRVPKGLRIEQPVSLRDIPATVLDLIGGESQRAFPGESLGRFLDGSATDTNSKKQRMILSELNKTPDFDYPASKGDMVSFVSGKYHYIHNENGIEELYDLVNDPKELINLIESTAHNEELKRFRSALNDTVGNKQ